MLTAIWTAICEWVLDRFKRKKERVEPVLEGYEKLVARLEKRLDDADADRGKHQQEIDLLKDRLNNCERRHSLRDDDDREMRNQLRELKTKVEECGKGHAETAQDIADIKQQINQ